MVTMGAVTTGAELLTVEAFLAQYGDDPRYELIDGVLRERDPTGPHERVAGNLAGRICCLDRVRVGPKPEQPRGVCPYRYVAG